MRRSATLTLWALLVFAPVGRSAAEETKPGPLDVVVTTADDERVAGPLVSLADGKLTIGADPPRALDLADVARIELGKTATAPAQGDVVWIGQDNHDLVQVGGAPGGNGIQDLHLRALKLKPLALKQVMVVCRFAKQLRVWRLDTSQSPHWRLAVARDGVAPEADLYLEPASDDSSGQTFDLTFTYSDDSTSKASLKGTTHTSDQQKVDRAQQPGQVAKTTVPVPAAKTELFLIDGGRLRGDLVELDAESIVVRTAWKAELRIPAVRVSGVWFGNSGPAGARADFDKQMGGPAADDVVFLVAPDKTAAQVVGGVQRLAEGKLNLKFEGTDRSINRDRLLGVVFAAHPKIAAPSGLYQTLVLASGDSISGRWTALAEGALALETPWDSQLSIPPSEVAEIRIRNGKVVYLSDLEPTAVQEVPYFGRVLHWRRNQGFDDGPPKLKGQPLAQSLGMHSRCLLTYALDEQYDKLKATLGFDDTGGGRGRVLCRVTVDGREAFVNNDVRADQDPLPVEVALSGAKQMTLEVDFGQGEDVGDRVLWAEPRLFHSEKK